MLSDLLRSLEMELEQQSRIKKHLEKRVKEIGCHRDAHLFLVKQRGHNRYYLSEKKEDKTVRRYLGKADTDIRKQLQEQYYLERALRLCHENIEMLDLVMDSYHSLDPVDVVKDAPLAYREQENATKLLYGYENELRWKQRKLAYKSKFSVPYPERLRHTASDGTITRSKSEALICDLLRSKNIPYVYDYPKKLCGKWKWPDFIILDRKNNRELLIEHLGLMSDADYQDDQYEKLCLYIMEGYIPNVNLLLTFDDKDGNINVPAISKMIDAIMCR